VVRIAGGGDAHFTWKKILGKNTWKKHLGKTLGKNLRKILRKNMVAEEGLEPPTRGL